LTTRLPNIPEITAPNVTGWIRPCRGTCTYGGDRAH